MPADRTAGHSDDRSTHCLTLTASARPYGESGRVGRISRRRSTNLPPIRAIRHHARGRFHNQLWILAPSISLLCVIAEGAGS